MTDLAREIEELLPCWAYSGCTGQAHERACLAWVRPAITTYVQRKLDEAKADVELLAKVGWLLPRRGQIEIRLDEDGDWYARSALIEHPASVRHGGGAPTLVEALRKLVEVDS